MDTVKAELSWDKPSITAGASTPLTLTAKMTYSNWEEASGYGASLLSMPTWFTPTGINCTGQQTGSSPFAIDPPTCSLAHFESTLGYDPDTGGFEATLTEGCIVYDAVRPEGGTAVQPNQPDPACGSGTATVSVVAATPAPTPTPTPVPTAAPTPPPTSSATSSPDGGGGIVWFLPVGMVALLGCLLAASRRRVRTH